MTGLLDVILLYDCNLACDYCTITPAMRTRALPTAAVVRALRAGRVDGYISDIPALLYYVKDKPDLKVVERIPILPE